MLFYAIIGIHLFGGAFEYRCRVTDKPPPFKEDWALFEDVPYICGTWKCPEE
jgi:hypothetical protein